MRATEKRVRDVAELKGYRVFTYSPGDGATRYRFVAAKTCKDNQGYFGPDNGVFTALGAKEALAFLGYRA